MLHANDTIDASSPPKKSSRLGDKFAQDKSADLDDQEMSIGGLKEEDVASQDGVSEAALAGEPSGMEMDSEDVEEGAIKAEEAEAGMRSETYVPLHNRAGMPTSPIARP
ncbi:hypothetical protein LTR97_012106 [Elasticomyces elasticus]|uniref:Uncharacterized protein n=1 Tax=Elasticomyces elasticus TaxID=574655 RepID=A0AAN7VM54_9PEZI|nr:hypothetical protein LTR97_012106 [Elasticomyces elasticus]